MYYCLGLLRRILSFNYYFHFSNRPRRLCTTVCLATRPFMPPSPARAKPQPSLASLAQGLLEAALSRRLQPVATPSTAPTSPPKPVSGLLQDLIFLILSSKPLLSCCNSCPLTCSLRTPGFPRSEAIHHKRLSLKH